MLIKKSMAGKLAQECTVCSNAYEIHICIFKKSEMKY